MVGSSSEIVEPSGRELLKENDAVKSDISEYLLLHHNYAKPLPKIKSQSKRSHISTKKLKTILPKVNTKDKLALDISTDSGLTTQSNNEIMYGTFDENIHTITLLVNEDSVPVNEVVLTNNIESIVDFNNIPLVVDNNSSTLSVPLSDKGNLSPRSDLGYESLDSPVSNSEMDTWDQSVSELFPSLW